MRMYLARFVKAGPEGAHIFVGNPKKKAPKRAEKMKEAVIRRVAEAFLLRLPVMVDLL